MKGLAPLVPDTFSSLKWRDTIMFEIPPHGDQPLIRVFDNSDELQKATGHRVCHGYFDAKENLIVATADSVAHEIGHFKDFRSGRMKVVGEIDDPQERIEARLRNEIVAILFSYAKCGQGGATLKHEVKFLDWIRYLANREDHSLLQRKIESLKFSEIQDLAEWLTLSTQSWFDRLQFIFRSYLTDEQFVLTYHASSKG